jgi:predicted PurR-regulated permease PerM
VSWYLVLQVVLTLGLLALIGFVINVLIQLHLTLKTFNALLHNLNRELPSILIKLQIALDGVNSELDKVEEIVNSFHEVSAKVQNTTGMVQRVVTSPVIRVASILSGAKTAVSSLVGRKKTGL